MNKFIDLFAGIGGFRLALESLNAKCVFSSEIDKYAVQTYQTNFGDVPHGDITKIDAKDIPDFDILCAGFPCQPFSIAGKQKGFKDERGNLFDEIIRIAEYHKPKVLFLENVKGLVSHDKGKTFEQIKKAFNWLDYYYVFKVIKSSDFGVPQARNRVYIIAFKNLEERLKFEWPQPIKSNITVGDILELIVSDNYYLSGKAWLAHQERRANNKANGKGFGYGLVNKESLATRTLTARYYKDGSEILIQNQRDSTPRRLTPRECARLQGYPDSFKIIVSDTQAYKQFGNSVTVNVIKAIGEEILKVI